MQRKIEIDESRTTKDVRQAIDNQLRDRYESPYPDDTMFFPQERVSHFNKAELLALEEELGEMELWIDGDTVNRNQEREVDYGNVIKVRRGSEEVEIQVPEKPSVLDLLLPWR